MFLDLVLANTSHCREQAKREQGSALLEFAIVIPFLVLLVGGLLDYSMAFKEKTALSDAVHAGARMAGMAEDLENTGPATELQDFVCDDVADRINANLRGARLNPEDYGIGFKFYGNTVGDTYLLVITRRTNEHAVWSRLNMVRACVHTAVRVDADPVGLYNNGPETCGTNVAIALGVYDPPIALSDVGLDVHNFCTDGEF